MCRISGCSGEHFRKNLTIESFFDSNEDFAPKSAITLVRTDMERVGAEALQDLQEN